MYGFLQQMIKMVHGGFGGSDNAFNYMLFVYCKSD